MPYCAALDNVCCIKTDGNFAPCCRHDALEESFPATTTSFDDFKQSSFYQKLREDMVTGWAPGCKTCQREEEFSKQSLRQRYNQRLSSKSNSIEFLDVSLSTHCNLSCKMCNNKISSAWHDIVAANPDLLNYEFHPANTVQAIDPHSVLKNIDLSNLKVLRYQGGEPFITPEIYDLIEYLDSKDAIKNCMFNCNTNATFFPSKLIDLLERFQSITISFSIDGMGDLCNYIRNGKTWDTVEPVINQWLSKRNNNSKYTLISHTTLQAYNLHQFEQIKQFADLNNLKFNFNILRTPEYLNLDALPSEYIKYLVDSKTLTDPAILDIVQRVKFNANSFERLKSFTEKTDGILNTSIHKTIPVLAEFLYKS